MLLFIIYTQIFIKLSKLLQKIEIILSFLDYLKANNNVLFP